MNPNAPLPLFRSDSRILLQKLKNGAAGEISRSHFVFKNILAQGQFGPVWLVEKLPEGEQMVMKIMDKCMAYNRRCVDTITNEF